MLTLMRLRQNMGLRVGVPVMVVMVMARLLRMVVVMLRVRPTPRLMGGCHRLVHVRDNCRR